VRIANVSGRLTLVSEEGGIDVEKASAGRFGPDPQAVFGQWKAFRRWADDAASRGAAPIDSGELGAPAPRPTLLPGDLIFSGTPAGIGAIRQPPEFLRPGQVLSSYLEGVGTMANRMIAPPT
jgi:hypothetical protein